MPGTVFDANSFVLFGLDVSCSLLFCMDLDAKFSVLLIVLSCVLFVVHTFSKYRSQANRNVDDYFNYLNIFSYISVCLIFLYAFGSLHIVLLFMKQDLNFRYIFFIFFNNIIPRLQSWKEDWEKNVYNAKIESDKEF